jgi:type II secretory pathway predicted ATPase ExeA
MDTGAAETAREIVRIAAYAGLPKDLIATMEKKATVLAERVATLEKELAGLKVETANLRAQLRLLPEEGEELSGDTIKILRLFFDRAGEISTEEIIKSFGFKPSVADYNIVFIL